MTAPAEGPPPARRRAKGLEDLREVRDPRDMRALAHPVRLALLEALVLRGPLTATAASELVGESPSSCSFHLRTLARHGFVEETGEGRGRERPWRRVGLGMNTVPEDDLGRIAARELGDMFAARYLDRLREARANRDRLPREWSDVQEDVEVILWVTAEELSEFNESIVELALAYRHRVDDPSQRPAGARPVEMLYFTYNADITSMALPADGEKVGPQR